jgi:histidyl-tRNA synthetase
VSNKFTPIRGFHDVDPNTTFIRNHIVKTFLTVSNSFGFNEINFPIVESLELFKRSVGNYTDIVNKEMYTLEDRNGDVLALRPEGTAGCVRAALGLGLIHNCIQRLAYQGPMFRYERPQKGRLRQFHQIGFETFGLESPLAELELIQIMHCIWEELNISKSVHLHLNYLGGLQTRLRFQKALKDYLTPHADALDEDSKQRLNHNVLRILDSKNPKTQALLEKAPSLDEFYTQDEHLLIKNTLSTLHKAHIDVIFDPTIVRGLDYYTGMVFEWMTDKLGAQGTICAGGRYDDLVQQLGGKSTLAVGLSAGIERIEALLSLQASLNPQAHCDIFIGISGTQVHQWLFPYLKELQSSSFNTQQGSCDVGIKSHLKSANKVAARYCILAGENELAHKTITIKDMGSGEQTTILPQNLFTHFDLLIRNPHETSL